MDGINRITKMTGAAVPSLAPAAFHSCSLSEELSPTRSYPVHPVPTCHPPVAFPGSPERHIDARGILQS